MAPSKARCLDLSCILDKSNRAEVRMAKPRAGPLPEPGDEVQVAPDRFSRVNDEQRPPDCLGSP